VVSYVSVNLELDVVCSWSKSYGRFANPCQDLLTKHCTVGTSRG
jgi:hypothetical protein